MKIVVDEDLSRSLGLMLQKLEHEVFDIRDYGLRGSPDEDIFIFAQKQKAVLFSGDLGFANTLKFPIGSHCGIVVLRFPNEMSTDMINSIIIALLAKISIEDVRGNLTILSPAGIRMRKN